VTADTLADNEIDCQNRRYSRSRLKPEAVSVADDDMIMVLVVVFHS
jgi:hypothetical protein